MFFIKELMIAGLIALKEYIIEHVITCLVPAFLLAGAMVTFIKKEAILKYLGEQANKLKSFSIASLSSFFLAVCSCTIIPVASGLYYSGAGIGVAFIVLWVAPATNILALIYTGNLLGAQIIIARVISAISMAFIVGFVMSFIFKSEKREIHNYQMSEETKIIEIKDLILLVLILISLLAPNYLIRKGLYINKVLVWFIFTVILIIYAVIFMDKEKIKSWLKESWWFVKTIFPLLLAGVFVVGVIGKIIPQEMIQKWLGGNDLFASFLATIIGSISYFATMTEAPFVHTLMKMGMGKGPALALLLTGPGLSLPNWFVIARVFGFKKALVYVSVIIILGTFVGFIFGNLF
ncbi:MAG: permease [Candidatus Goldbacteria bacterium]|nr:permease [Candidatus Goldiibacteriota bacterium]